MKRSQQKQHAAKFKLPTTTVHFFGSNYLLPSSFLLHSQYHVYSFCKSYAKVMKISSSHAKLMEFGSNYAKVSKFSQVLS